MPTADPTAPRPGLLSRLAGALLPRLWTPPRPRTAVHSARGTRRVLHLAAGNLYGGVETFLVTLERHRALCPSLEPHFALCFEGRLGDELRGCGAAVHALGEVRFSRFWTIWGARRRLRRLLAEEGIDVVCCHGSWPHAAFAPTVRAAGRSLVYWAHDVPTGRHWLERWA